jgi:hypothetical protein
MTGIPRDALVSAAGYRTYNRAWRLGIAGKGCHHPSGSPTSVPGIGRMADDAWIDMAERMVVRTFWHCTAFFSKYSAKEKPIFTQMPILR